MKNKLVAIGCAAFGILVLSGCDSAGGKIQPLSGQGGPAKGNQTAAGPHPMPGASPSGAGK